MLNYEYFVIEKSPPLLESVESDLVYACPRPEPSPARHPDDPVSLVQPQSDQSPALPTVRSASPASVEHRDLIHPAASPDVDLLGRLLGLVVHPVQALPPVSEPLAPVTSVRPRLDHSQPTNVFRA